MKTVEDDSEAHGGDGDHGDGADRWDDANCDGMIESNRRFNPIHFTDGTIETNRRFPRSSR